MMCVLQIGLCVLGVVLMRKKEIRFGQQVARGGTPFLVGLPLVAQLPLAFMIAFGLGVSAGVDAAKQAQSKSGGRSDAQAQAQMQAIAQKKAAEFQAKYWWIDVAVPFAALLLSGMILALGLKDDEPRSTDDLLAKLAGNRYDDEDDDPRPRPARKRYDDYD
jgi:hypothetical protein